MIPPPPRSRHLLSATLLLTLLLTLLIFTDWLPYLRGPAPETSEWYWPYQLRPFSHWWAPTLAALLLWSVGWWGLRAKPHPWLWLPALFATSLLLQLGLIHADRPDIAAELIDRTLSNPASGFFEPAAEIGNMAATLQNYPAVMPSFASEHAQTHPPGLIVANWATVQLLGRLPAVANAVAPAVWAQRCTDLWLLNRPPNVAAALAVWAWLPLLAAAAVVFPAFALARRLVEAPATYLATLLTATLPALLLFAPKSVQLYPLLTLLILLLLERGIRQQEAGWLLGSGLLLSLASFLSLGNAALVLPIALFGGYLLHHHQRPWLRPTMIFGVGASMLWLLYWVGWGVPPWAIAQVGLGQHYELVTLLRRYDWWLWGNLVDLLTYTGLPVLVGFWGYLLATRRERPAWWLAAGLLLLIVLLDVSGSARGEVGRIWLFFTPLLGLLAASWWGQMGTTRQLGWLLAGQLLLTVALGLAWRPVQPVIVVAKRPFQPTVPLQTPLAVSFVEGDAVPLSLQGYTLQLGQVQPGGELGLTLFWEANGGTKRPFTVFNQLLNSNGELVAQQDNWPVQEQWPPTCWERGEQITDSYTITLPDTLPAGNYTLITGLYDAQTGQRLRTSSGQDAVTLTSIPVP